MNQIQLRDAAELVQFADRDAPTFIQQVGMPIPDIANMFFADHPDCTLSRDTVEQYITSHCGLG